MRSRGVAALVALLALAACDLGPRPQPVKVTLPAAWSAPVQGADTWPAQDWWRAFQSPELDTLIAAAQTGNLDIAAAAARILQADAQLRIAGASLLPQLNLNGGLKQSGPAENRTVISSHSSSASNSLNSDLNGNSGSSGASSQRTTLALSIGAKYELDFWGKNHDQVQAARQSLNASRYDRETVGLTVTSSVASTYFQVMALRDRLALAHQSLANAQSVERVVAAKARDGAVSGLDLAQQQAEVAAQQAAIPPLELQQSQALNALALLLGRNPEGFQLAGGGLAGITLPGIGAGLPSALLTRRPDVKEAEANLAAANGNLLAARAAMLPSINLNGALNLEAIATSLSFGGLGAAYSAAAALSEPIFDAGQLRAEKDVAAGKRQELVQAYRGSILSALADVENALAAIASLDSEQRFLDAQITQADAALVLAQAQYRAGATDLLPVLDAQRTLFQAQDQRTQVVLSRFQSAISLYKALGGGWQSGAAETTARSG
jgi:NodT family efflux transporter outer membrane factor (OMF) lipoprotein